MGSGERSRQTVTLRFDRGVAIAEGYIALKAIVFNQAPV